MKAIATPATAPAKRGVDRVRLFNKGSSSDPEPNPQISRIDQIFELLRAGHLSPFDLVLKVLDDRNARYSSYRAEFYRKDSQKLFTILDAISINGLGRKKLRRWMQQSQGLGIFCDIINDEMNTVKGVEKLPGLAAITPEFIKS